jgi:hypothetical protein
MIKVTQVTQLGIFLGQTEKENREKQQPHKQQQQTPG